ncbi:uncharacterized protein si:ch211-188c16.1 [Nematolebias whitei]|uniref:uncharacterized protein si:ch211-188c16.1 n=1 Tax=Nematolebias whitei TaxID=451745 RepID=UPI001896D1D7|nr:uncharacterized protein si:ch211-188c16.1 [Nematolebias whitei]
MNVELNIKEMLELGKKAQAACREGNKEADTISIGSRSSTHPILTSSFTDDSEEWACEDTLSPSIESHVLQQSASEPDTSCVYGDAQQTVGDANLEDLHTQIRHEALQKLSFFLQSTKNEPGLVPDGGGATPTKYSIIPNLSQASEIGLCQSPRSFRARSKCHLPSSGLHQSPWKILSAASSGSIFYC